MGTTYPTLHLLILHSMPLCSTLEKGTSAGTSTGSLAIAKKSVVRRSVPKEVQSLLETEMQTEGEDSSPLGWNTWRIDVLVVDLAAAIFHLIAIFLFTA